MQRSLGFSVLIKLCLHLPFNPFVFSFSSRLGCRDARRRNSRNRRLDVRDPHGRDQSPPADGRRSGDEAIQRFISLHHGNGEGGGTWCVLQELGHQLPARVPRQHGGVHRVRASHRRPPGRTRQRWAAPFRVWIVSTTSRHNDSCFLRVFLSVFVCFKGIQQVLRWVAIILRNDCYKCAVRRAMYRYTLRSNCQ